MPHSDTIDLARWRKQRDARAFQQIIDRYSGLVFAAGRRITGNVQDAEDITQKCFLKLAESPPSIEYSLGGWLHRVATNLAINDTRKGQSRETREEKYHVAQSDSHEAVWDDLQEVIDEAIEQLPDKFKEPLIAHYFGVQTYEVISKQMGISRQTVSYRVGKGIEHIRKFLSRKGHIVGAATLASMLQALTAEPVPAALAHALSKLALSGVGMSAKGPLAALIDVSAFGLKPMWWLSLAAGVIGALGGMWWISKLAEVRGASTPIVMEPSVQRDALLAVSVASDLITEEPIPEVEVIVVVSQTDDGKESSGGTGKEDGEEEEQAPLLRGMVVNSTSGRPIPNVRILVYPEESVNFSIEKTKDLPAFHGRDKEDVETVHAALNITAEDIEPVWYLFSNRAHFEPDRSSGVGFVTDEQGYFDAESLVPGTYMVVMESEDYSARGQAVVDLGVQGTAHIDGFSTIYILEQGTPQAFTIVADPRSNLQGRIFDQSTGIGVSQVKVHALRLTTNPSLSISEASTITDGEGTYAFEGLQIGRYIIVRDEIESFHGDQSRELEVHFTSTNRADFPVGRGTVIAGTVYWGDVPAANIDFTVNYSDSDAAFGAKLVDHPIYTDENGHFLVAGIRSFIGILYGTARLTDRNSVTSNWVQNLSLSEGDFWTIDLKFDIGTASIEGRFTQAGKPISGANVIWYSGNVNGMQQRTSTDSDGNYRFEGLPSGPSVIAYFYPRTYAGASRPIHVNDAEQLQFDVDVPEGSFTFFINNLPKEMRKVWVYVFDGDYEMPNSFDHADWITQRRFDRKAMSRIFARTPGTLKGLPPGSYKLIVNASPNYGYYSHYVDDPDLLQDYFDKSMLLFMDVEVTSSTNGLITIDYSKAEPLSDYFSFE